MIDSKFEEKFNKRNITIMVDSAKMIEKVKILCKENGIKIADLENKLGLSQGNLSRWAKSCPLAIITLAQIAEILNTSVDYLLDTGSSYSNNGRSNTLNNLIEQTGDRRVEWKKLSYSKSKQIPEIKCVNELVYDSNVYAYDTKFLDKHLLFVHYKNNNISELYLENNNEYIMICDNDSFAQRLYKTINNEKQNIINEFFNS